jgi:predicted patatin/cPLA2 family phospholipase
MPTRSRKAISRNLVSLERKPLQREEPGARARCTFTLAVALGLLLQGCATPPRGEAVPTGLETKAMVVGFPDHIRYYPRDPEDIKRIEKEFVDSWSREKQYLRPRGQSSFLPPASYLAISGGGDDGAYGAGFLNGWSQTGTRPEFKLVTGVSTGALTAPFAFLGKDYDPELKLLYTSVSQKDILAKRNLYAAVFGDAMSDTTPLYHLIKKYVTQEMLNQIAAEYAKGRLLFIGTVDLDSERPVIWNITKIAASHSASSLELVHKILRASAAIPGAFPPVMINVQANGRSYTEMHVDGSVAAQVFVYWAGVRLNDLAAQNGGQRRRTVYILRNARLDPEWSSVKRQTLSITFKAIAGLLEYQGLDDLYRIYAVCQRDGTEFNLAYIPKTFTEPERTDFDRAYMQKLYDFGFQDAKAGYHWAKEPPMLVGQEATPVGKQVR